ncbi:NAD(P)H-flavin oxidoreductase [Bacteroidia bacterium]|nr:NAD(P)H-flavin oxidoreductase [Bacteroidia bacterium]
MDIFSAIMERRSVRSYVDRPIPRETLEAIMQAALMAPSAVDLQPWYFVVVESAEAFVRLKEIMDEVGDEVRPTLAKRFPDYPDLVRKSCGFIKSLGNAPVCVLAFQYKADYQKSQSSMVQSVSAAIENMILAAWEMGVGSCWISAPIETGLDKKLQQTFAPDKGEFVAMITLGYPEKIPNMPKRKEGRVRYV